MRHIAIAAALLFAISSQSQQSSQPAPVAGPVAAPAPLVEKIDVSVVNVEVTVTDRHGQPVTGLKQDDFEVFEDGKQQPISNFYAVENAQVQSGPGIETIKETIPAPVPERFRRKVLVLIDNLWATGHGRNAALDKLESFVNEHFDDGRYDVAIATVDNHVHLLLPMTSDKKVLHEVLSRIRNSGSRGANTAPIVRDEMALANVVPENPVNNDFSGVRHFQTQEKVLAALANFNESANLAQQSIFADQSMEGITEAVRAFGTSEGRKILLLVTGYLPVGTVSPLSRVGDGQQYDSHIQDLAHDDSRLVAYRDRLVREANASNASIYIISTEGIVETATDVGVGRDQPIIAGVAAGSSPQDTAPMYWLARETGGVFMPGNRIERSFIDFDRRSASFYSLGYRPPHPEDTGYHRLSVHVKGYRGYQLQYREGYSSTSTDLQMMRTLGSPLGAAMQPSTMTVSLILGKPLYHGITALLPIKAAMSMEALQYITDTRGSRTRLHVYVSIFDPDGRNITVAKSFADIVVQPNETTTGPMTVTLPPLMLAKGTYRVVVAVRDELTDHVGLVTQKINL
ncbi:MAG TPA: VWA domain-containing protein [Thermoanaerobaculia bacterium]|jgi:VWFA-related protein|nr:VWA domain-containing protein [Thermoanaerobaculia bacterium]